MGWGGIEGIIQIHNNFFFFCCFFFFFFHKVKLSNLSSLCGCKDINPSQIYTGETTISRSGTYFFLAIGKIPKNSKARTKQKLKLLNPFLR